MGTKKIFILITTVSLLFIFTGLGSTQEATEESVSPPAAEEPAAAQPTLENATEPEIQWLWGEVVSVDAQNNALVVKYLDYETESEKELNIVADEKTTYENVQSLLDVKPLDTVSIDYIISDAKNIAKNISVEKPEVVPEGTTEEETPPVQAPTTNTEAAPEVRE